MGHATVTSGKRQEVNSMVGPTPIRTAANFHIYTPNTRLTKVIVLNSTHDHGESVRFNMYGIIRLLECEEENDTMRNRQ